MRSKFVVIFLGSLMILTGVLAWRAYELLKTEQKAALESQLRAQSTFASSGVESELQSVTRMMELAESEILRAGSSLPNSAVYQEFELIAKVSMPGAQGPDWKFEAKSFKEVSAIKDWAPTYLEVLFKKSSETDLRADSTLVFALPDPQKKPYLVVMQKIPQSSQSASSQVRVAILRSSWMQKLMDRSKGETATLRVINQLGQVVGHPTVEYVGSSLREDALVQNVMNSQVGTGSGIFETPEGPVLGQYEQVGASNLFVTLTVPTQVLYKNKKVILVQLLTIGVGISLLALAGFLWLVDNAKDLAVANAGVGANHMAPGAVGVAGVPTTAAGTVNAANTAVGAASAATNTFGAASATSGTANTMSAVATTAISLKEKMNIYTKVASGLSHELKAPVTAILGQTRVLRSELGSNHASIDKIEFEARHASELIQKLMAFSGEDKFKPTKSNVEALLQRALKSIEGKMLGKGVKLTKKIQSLPEIYLAPELFIKAVVSLLENAIEAMERAPKKELLVEASVVKGEIEITIQDSGEGISAVHLPKIFDPFFTTRTHQNHVGLGLATAQGIIKEMNGDIKIHSVEGQGVTAKIFLHPDEAISEVAVSTTPVATSVPTPAVAATAEVTPVATTAAPVVKELKVPEMDSEKLLSELMDETLDVVAIKDELSGLYKENTGSKKIENDKIEIEVHVGETQDVLINDSIEKMMDDLDLEVAGAIAPALSGAKVSADSAAVASNAAVSAVVASNATVAGVSSGSMSVKNNDSLVVMDQPKQDMSPVKKESKLDQFLVKIRRPSLRQNANPNESSDIGRANIEKDPS